MRISDKEIIDFLLEAIHKPGRVPSTAEVANHFEVKTPRVYRTVSMYLTPLQWHKYNTRSKPRYYTGDDTDEMFSEKEISEIKAALEAKMSIREKIVVFVEKRLDNQESIPTRQELAKRFKTRRGHIDKILSRFSDEEKAVIKESQHQAKVAANPIASCILEAINQGGTLPSMARIAHLFHVSRQRVKQVIDNPPAEEQKQFKECRRRSI